MAVTAIADIINPEVLADQVSAKFPDQLVLGNTNLVEVDTTFPLGSPGTYFKMPFWKRIGEFGALTEGTAMTPGKIGTGAEYAVVQRGGAAYEVYDTASLVSKADPAGEISGQIGKRAAQYIDAALVAVADKTPNTYDASASTYTDTSLNGLLVPNALISGMLKLGDNYARLFQGGAIIMHSKPYGDLMKQGVIQNQYQSGMDVLRTGVIPTLLGLPIIVSDRVTTVTASSVTTYKTYVVGPGSLALFYQRNVKVEFDRDILLQADVIAATVHFAPHMFGWCDQEDKQTAEDAKSIHVIAVTTK